MFKGIFDKTANKIGKLGLQSRILGLFITLIIISVLVAAGSTYTIGKSSVENMVEGQLSNSVRFVIDQISLLSGAYTSKQFSDKLNYVLTSEKAGFNSIKIDADIYLVDSSGFEINRDNINEKSIKKSDLPESFISEALKSKKGLTNININNKAVTVAYGYILEKDWIYAVAVSKSSYMSFVYKLQAAALISGALGILAAIILSILGTRGLVGTLKEINKTVSKAGGGDFTARVKFSHGGREIRDTAENLNLMLSNIGAVLKNLGTSINDLKQSNRELKNISDETDESAVRIHNISLKMSTSSESQRELLLKLDRSTNEILAILRGITDETCETACMSGLMQESVKKGIKSIKVLEEKIREIEKISGNTFSNIEILNKKSIEINRIAGTVKSISQQIKLLSFNAAIEAAKAGDTGAGFAVVAKEIGKLAESSADSVREVDRIITEINSNTKSVLDIANQCREVSHEGAYVTAESTSLFNEIRDNVGKTHLHVNKVAEAANMISENTREYIGDIGHIRNVFSEMLEDSQMIFMNADKHKRLSSGIARHAYSLLDMADSMDELKSRFIT